MFMANSAHDGTLPHITAPVHDRWIHLAIVQSEGQAVFYIDGEENGIYQAYVPVNDRWQIAIGNEDTYYFAGQQSYFSGYMKHVTFYNRALTSAEVVADRDAVKGAPLDAACLSSRDCLPGLRCDSKCVVAEEVACTEHTECSPSAPFCTAKKKCVSCLDARIASAIDGTCGPCNQAGMRCLKACENDGECRVLFDDSYVCVGGSCAARETCWEKGCATGSLEPRHAFAQATPEEGMVVARQCCVETPGPNVSVHRAVRANASDDADAGRCAADSELVAAAWPRFCGRGFH
jgi:hypothetical protein